MNVRPARDEELDAVAALIVAAFAEHLPSPEAEVSPALRTAVARYRAELADVRGRLAIGRLLVAEVDAVLVASVTLQHPGVAPWPGGWASIRLLSVDPSHRGRGLGRGLTDVCVSLAREQGAVMLGLHTTSQLAVARAMYRRMGFARVPELDEWPAPEIHAEAYALSLTG